MNNLEWHPVYYNGLETNVEVTKCGEVRRVKKYWLTPTRKNFKIGEVDFSKLKLHRQGYKFITIQVKGYKQKTVYIQQLMASVFLGYNFEGHKIVVDHIDSNKLNNNVKNLRLISHRENCSKEKTIKSGLPVGVCYRKKINKYQASITVNKNQIYLGYFKTMEEASNAYQNKLKEISITKNN
jgi:hypothetical protein